MLRFSHTAAAAAVALVAPTAIATVVQVPLPFNADLVREVGGTVTGGGVDLAGRAFVTQSEAAANDGGTPHGLPDNGLIPVEGGTIQLGPYDGNNALRFGTFGTNSATVFIPIQPEGAYDSIRIYGAGATSSTVAPPSLIVRLQSVPGSAFEDAYLGWKGGNSNFSLVNGLDTTAGGGTGFENVDNAGIACWSRTIPLQGVGPISGLIINGVNRDSLSSTAVSIFAVTLTRVPEPATAGLATVAGAAVLLRRRR
jgi:hypothetical protein